MGEFFEALGIVAKVKKDEPMAKHTSFKIGGAAKYFAEIDSLEALKKAMALASEYGVRTMVLGKGSNVLVSDEGIDALVLHMGASFSEIRAEGDEIVALSGASLSKIAQCAYENSLTGFEFAAGIPGSLGGAVYMNAGAYGGQMSDVVTKSSAISPQLEEISVTEHNFGYRTSIYKDSDLIITEARIKLSHGNKGEISEKMNELAKKRREKQPLEYPSAGSVFKRPEGFFAGALIEGAGLKGLKVGGAEVSGKHAGFIVNTGGATANDVKKLIEIIKTKVYEKYNVVLETEIKFI